MCECKTKKKNLASVIVTTYNHGEFICEALDSIKDQTYQDIELIVIDDCSTDNTEQIVKSWHEKSKNRFENFLYLKMPRNCSSVWCLNIGFQIARGEYIVIHDADDISHKDKIKRQVEHLINNPNISAVGTKFQAFIDTKDRIGWIAAWLSYDIKEIQDNYIKSPIKHCVSFGTLLFRANIICTLIGCKRILRVANDVNFVRDIVRRDYIVDNLNEVLFYVRLHSKRRISHYRNLRIEHNKRQRTKVADRVSVVLPVTNDSKNTIRALKSIIQQDYPNIEIIIIDDGCDKKIESNINRWYKRYKNMNKATNIKDIIYFELPVSVGYPWIYNIGSYLSKGEYIIFHNSEGLSLKNKIKEQVRFLKNNPDYSVVGTNTNDENNNIKFGYRIKRSYLIDQTNCVNINTIMMKSYIIDENAGLSRKTEGNEDFEFIYRLLYNGYKVENLPGILYYE